MKINLLFTIFAILAAFAFLFVGDQAESLDITKIIQGTVKEAKNNSVKVTEDAINKEIQITIGTYTTYDNIQKLSDLNAGDRVQIVYKIDGNKNTAITVTKLEEEN